MNSTNDTSRANPQTLFSRRVVLSSVCMLAGSALIAQAEPNDYHPGQPVTFKSSSTSTSETSSATPVEPTPPSPAGEANSNEAGEKRLNWGRLGNSFSGVVNELGAAARRPSTYVNGAVNGAAGNFAGAAHGHVGGPNPAYPNGYHAMQAGPGYHPDGSGAGVGLDYNYIYSHPPNMSGMPPVRPEFAETVNTMSDMAAQMGTTGSTTADGWYTPGRPKGRSLQAPGADPLERSLDLNGLPAVP